MNIVKYEIQKRLFSSNALMAVDENGKKYFLLVAGSALKKDEADEFIVQIAALLTVHHELKEMVKEEKANE